MMVGRGIGDMRFLGIAVSLALVAGATPVFAYCSEPSAPYCASRYGAFDDQDEFRRCRSEMESYQSEVQDFLSCMKRKSDSVIQEYNSAVESFNRRARG
jgi:hypothetical protein